MPSEIPQLPGFRIAATSQPARIVGGDYFDVLPLNDGARAICIGDVCGKGVPAALLMANLQAAVKICVAERMGPRDLCETVNRVMCGNLAEGFITFFYAVLETTPPRLTYCNAGHNPPILTGAGESSRPSRLSTGGGILGVFPDWRYEEAQVPLTAGNHILMYTDGITESRNAAGEEFGEDRLVELVLAAPHGSATLAANVVAAAAEFSNGNFTDDLTVVGISMD
jgi:sigma-B regulation protein RsbU (phosphoserine phosphatase)